MQFVRKIARNLSRQLGSLLERNRDDPISSHLIQPAKEILHNTLAPFILVIVVLMLIAIQLGENPLTDIIQQKANLRISHDAIQDRDVVVILIDDRTIFSLGEQYDSQRSIECLIAALGRTSPRVIGLDYYFARAKPSGAEAEVNCNFEISRSSLKAPVVEIAQVSHSSSGLRELGADAFNRKWNKVASGHGIFLRSPITQVVRAVPVHLSQPIRRQDIPAFALSVWGFSLFGERVNNSPASGKTIKSFLTHCRRQPSDGCPALYQDGSDELSLRFIDPYTYLRVVSAHDLLSGACSSPALFDAVCSDVFNNKIVLIGSFNQKTEDNFLTPLSTSITSFVTSGEWSTGVNQIPGVLIHGIAVQNLIDKAYLTKAPNLALSVTLLLAILAPISVAAIIWGIRHSTVEPILRHRWLDYIIILMVLALCTWQLYEAAIVMMVERAQELPLAVIFGALVLATLISAALMHAIYSSESFPKFSALDRHLVSRLKRPLRPPSDKEPIFGSGILFRFEATSTMSEMDERSFELVTTAFRRWFCSISKRDGRLSRAAAFVDNWAYDSIFIHFFQMQNQSIAALPYADALYILEKFTQDMQETDTSSSYDLSIVKKYIYPKSHIGQSAVIVGALGRVRYLNLNLLSEQTVYTASGDLPSALLKLSLRLSAPAFYILEANMFSDYWHEK